ncbi:MAG: glycosyltransferase family 1 protein, partial [Syntrophobacteraceae bacterium]
YLYRLISELANISTNEKYYLFVDRDIHPNNIINHPRVEVLKIPECKGYRFNSWLHYKLQLHILRNRYDLVYYPHNVLPIYNPTKVVLGIHDAKLFRIRNTLLGRYVADAGMYLPMAVKRADRVICMSRFSLLEIERDIGDLNNAIVVHEGISPIYDIVKIDGTIREKIRIKYGITNKFILALAASAKYKNVNMLVESFDMIRNKLPDKYKLVLVGSQSVSDVDFINTIQRRGLNDDVTYTGYIPDQELIVLYNCAECFVFPSLYEGFGFPPLEAMACGTPVLTSNVSSIPEIVEDACVQADATDKMNFSEALYDFLINLRNVEYRKRIVEKGYAHAKRFSWNKTAVDTLKIFNEIIS